MLRARWLPRRRKRTAGARRAGADALPFGGMDADRVAFRAAPLDGPARLAIAAGGGLALLVIGWLLRAATDAPGSLWGHPAWWLAVVLIALLGPAVVSDWLRAPTGYSLGGGELRIHRRRGKDMAFPVTGEVDRCPEATALRRRGVFYGCRWIPVGTRKPRRNPFKEEGPSIYVAATDLSRAVQLEIPRGTAIVTPADPDAFVDAAEWRL